MTCERNSDNKHGFISLILRHLRLLFKQWMLLEKKSGFFPQHDKGFMQLRLRDILGNYAEKKWGHCSHRSTHNKNSPATKPFVRDCRGGLLNIFSASLTSRAGKRLNLSINNLTAEKKALYSLTVRTEKRKRFQYAGRFYGDSTQSISEKID